MKFRKKPVVIEAVQFTGQNGHEVMDWIEDRAEETDATIALQNAAIVIGTLEGDMLAAPGDWIIRGVKGEFYPCKPDIFAATYEVAE